MLDLLQNSAFPSCNIDFGGDVGPAFRSSQGTFNGVARLLNSALWNGLNRFGGGLHRGALHGVHRQCPRGRSPPRLRFVLLPHLLDGEWSKAVHSIGYVLDRRSTCLLRTAHFTRRPTQPGDVSARRRSLDHGRVVCLVFDPPCPTSGVVESTLVETIAPVYAHACTLDHMSHRLVPCVD